MKIINNKNISLFSIIIFIVFIFIMAYSASVSYYNYKEVDNDLTHVHFINKLNTILHKLEEEKNYSAIYLGSKKEKDFKKLKIYRKEILSQIEESIVYTNQNIKFVPYQKILQR